VPVHSQKPDSIVGECGYYGDSQVIKADVALYLNHRHIRKMNDNIIKYKNNLLTHENNYKYT